MGKDNKRVKTQPNSNLNIRWNKLQYFIPPEIGELKQLTHLYLSFNNLKGEIPKELANLHELRYLHLHENHFTGQILATYTRAGRLVGSINSLILQFHCFFRFLCNFFYLAPSRTLYWRNSSSTINALLAYLVSLPIDLRPSPRDRDWTYGP
ncbi:hypothetical protein R3W88_022790 [Solanum pinnatisectum]|uniref:Uncharacterized protein n=1 Tax=Solanum pinnatisectum TaxID=50273 RepID=A0AAV9LVP4_9SOLN|nr:hypothetical protein R3W88_022790 [Solanum pinnatisectum]